MNLVQDTSSKLIIPYVPVPYGTGTYDLQFECAPDKVYKVQGTKCQCALILDVEHSCTDPTKINFDIGYYQMTVSHSLTNMSIFMTNLKIFIPQ